MNEVNILNIGGIDYNIDDQLARDVIAHSENGLDSQSNLPVSSRHYDEGDYLIGQDRLYYEAITDIEVGDVIADGVNVRATNISEELVRLKNQSSIAVIQSIAKMESAALSSRNYMIGQYFYWDFGLTAGLYETIATITSGDAFSVGVNIKLANKIADTMDGLQDAYNITGAKNLCPNNAVDTVTTDITWDVLRDGSIQVSGTAASNRYIQLNSSITLPAGTYTITTGQSNESTADVIMIAQKKSNNEVIARSNSYELSATFTLSQETEVFFSLWTVHTNVAINVRVFPMCRVASVTDESYAPYAMTNKQLTLQLSNLENVQEYTLVTDQAVLHTCGKVAVIDFSVITGSFAEGETVLGTLAAGYRPRRIYRNCVCTRNDKNNVFAFVKSNGDFGLYAFQPATGVAYGQLFYFIED